MNGVDNCMDEIVIQFDENAQSFIVSLPEFVTLNALKIWGKNFLERLKTQPDSVGLLFDSNRHNFESIECLKWLKVFFMEELSVNAKVNRVAFVQPEKYKPASIVSNVEAYFINVQDAYNWLWQDSR